MRYPNSISASVSEPRRSGAPRTVPRKGTPRGPAGRPVPQRPRRSAPNKYPGRPPLPSFPVKPDKAAKWNYTGVVKRMARHMRLGVYGDALITLSTFQMGEYIGSGWTKEGVCRLEWTTLAYPGSQYCGPYGAFGPVNTPWYDEGVTSERHWIDAYYENYNPGNINPNRYSFRLKSLRLKGDDRFGPGPGILSKPGYELRPARSVVAIAPQIYPNVLPWIFPDLLPVAAPNIVVAPKPVQNPIRVPRPLSPQMPEVGPRPAPRPRPAPLPVEITFPGQEPVTVPLPLPMGLPRTYPGAGFKTELQAGFAPRVRPNLHHAQKPPEGTKETKARMGPVAAAIWYGVGPFTEVDDYTGALYEALPKNLKRKIYRENGNRQPNPLEKAVHVYANINKLDIGKALKNIIENEIEDNILGRIGKKAGEANRAQNRPIGFTAGFAL